jgi:predicted aconitase
MSYEPRMEITEEQRAILRGAEGPMMAKCLQTLLRHGDTFGARCLVPIKSAHLAGTFKILFYSAYYDLVHRLAESGIKVKVPTTLDPRPGYDFRIQNRFAFWGQRRLEAELEALGVLPNYSCVCYAQANVPKFGDVLGWAESSAIIYANSVIGARTNRNAIMIDVCQAVTGLAPEFGYLLDENRFGQIHIKLDIETMDAPALGFLIGHIAVDRVPVLDHYPFTKTELKNMGAAMAASGAVALFHVIGLTPEAPSMEAVFPNGPEEVHTITQKDLDDLRRDRLSPDDLGGGPRCRPPFRREETRQARHISSRSRCLRSIRDARDRQGLPRCRSGGGEALPAGRLVPAHRRRCEAGAHAVWQALLLLGGFGILQSR